MMLGMETFKCPRCKRPVRLVVRSSMSEHEWLLCSGCGYRAMVNAAPILDKYGIPHGLSKNEKQDIAKHLPRQCAVIGG